MRKLDKNEHESYMIHVITHKHDKRQSREYQPHYTKVSWRLFRRQVSIPGLERKVMFSHRNRNTIHVGFHYINVMSITEDTTLTKWNTELNTYETDLNVLVRLRLG